MIGPDAIVAGCALALAVAAGLVAHEWSHALALKLARVEYSLEYFPDETDSDAAGALAAVSRCPWAVVKPRPTGREPPWHLRVAALMPLTLGIPVLALGVAGYLSPTENLVVTAAALGWLACAIPSPQDFSVAFYAHRVLETERRRERDLDVSADSQHRSRR